MRCANVTLMDMVANRAASDGIGECRAGDWRCLAGLRAKWVRTSLLLIPGRFRRTLGVGSEAKSDAVQAVGC